MDSRRFILLGTIALVIPVAIHAFQGISTRMNKSSVPASQILPLKEIELRKSIQSGEKLSSDTPHSFAVSSAATLSSYVGGSGIDSATAASANGSGMIVCGLSSSSNFPTTAGAQQSSLLGSSDAFVCSLDAGGHRLWSRYFGGPGSDAALACCHSGSKVYVVGRTSSNSGVASSDSYQSAFGGGSADAFVAEFDESNGQLLHCSYYGGSDFDEARAVCILPNGNVAVGGTTNSTDLSMNGQQTQSSGAVDAFVIVLSPDLHSRVWSSYYGGRSGEEGRGIGALSDGSVVFCGNTGSPNSGAFIAANVGEGSAPPGGLQTSGFLVRFDANGMRTWGRYVGGDHLDTMTCLVVKNDNIFIGGFTNSAAGSSNNFISANSAQTVFAGGNSDAFVCRIGQDGVKVWGSYVGGSGDDQCLALTVNDGLDVVCCGTTSSSDFPASAGESATLHGPSDAFCTFFVRDGSDYPASFLIGGKADDYACGVSLQTDQSVVLCGGTSSIDLATQNAFQSSFGGAVDAFVQSYPQLYVVSTPDETNDDVNLLVYPNPCSESLSLEVTPSATGIPMTVCVFDALGRTVISNHFSNQSKFLLDIRSLAPGNYSVVVGNDSRLFHSHFVKL